MKTIGLPIRTILIVVLFMVGWSAAQEEMRHVDNSVFAKITRPASVFAHDQHNEVGGLDDCIECHHVYEDGRRLEDESSEESRCADCHDGSKDGPALSLRKAFHRNCKGCHLELKAGPILCGECHRRAR